MAHRVKVLSADSLKHHQTLRMHYANCNAYNADFDGDEINVHFPQSELGRAEAATLALNSAQYIVPTAGRPVRGLIQDHVDAAVKLTAKGTFLARELYRQLLHIALTGLRGNEALPAHDSDVRPSPPCVLYPRASGLRPSSRVSLGPRARARAARALSSPRAQEPRALARRAGVWAMARSCAPVLATPRVPGVRRLYSSVIVLTR